MTVDRQGAASAVRPHPDDRFLRYWLFWVSLGESVGFLAPALAQLAFGDAPVRVPALILAGALEGTVLGWTQATVLRSRIPALSRSRWVGATAIGASVAWFIGLLPAEWADVWQRWPAPAQLGVGLAAGVLLLTSIGIAQWTELKRHRRAAGWWIAGSAAAWCAGLAVFFAVATPLWQPGQSAAVVLLIGMLAGVLMAVGMALTSGLVLVGILRTKSPSQPV
ncbi:hypothetical protein BJQ94_04045 [Cryobacterium sp. SO2]|uniref:hypothetical protein n=1 Tax=Cryobacterium sp. SO2 TaxID=1897060 RepID=UPI00223DDAB6|nr:hypothetical protein [Cryobacterium sp. SO2]WEO78217.1 hypothetical protein BJQ94_04045 [Cryobacterium sp. SO2]